MTKKVVDPNANILRTLSTGTIISSLLFGKLPAAKQTEILAVAQAAGKPFVFVDSFGKLSNTRDLAERLLRGDDVTMELEFNSITLTDDERDGIAKVRPLLERLKALKPAGYPWLSDEEHKAAAKTEFRYWDDYSSEVYDRNGSNSVSKVACNRIWKLYAPFVMGGEKPKSFTMRVGYQNRTITFNDDFSVKVGCTTITRAGVEAVAKKFKFDIPNS